MELEFRLEFKHRSLLPKLWIFVPHCYDVGCAGLTEEGLRRKTGPLHLWFSCSWSRPPTICGEWSPSGVPNVTCPDRGELAIHLSQKRSRVGGAPNNPNSFSGLGGSGTVGAHLTPQFTRFKVVLQTALGRSLVERGTTLVVFW